MDKQAVNHNYIGQFVLCNVLHVSAGLQTIAKNSLNEC